MDLSKVEGSVTWMFLNNGWVSKNGYCNIRGDIDFYKNKLISDLRALKSKYPCGVSNEWIDELTKNLEKINDIKRLAVYIYRMYIKGCHYNEDIQREGSNPSGGNQR